MSHHHSNGQSNFLSADDPDYSRWASAVQFEADPRVRQMSAVLIGSCPPSTRHDPLRTSEHLQGATTASVISSAIAHAERLAGRDLQEADTAKDELAHANSGLRSITEKRRKLPTTPVDGPHGRRVTPAENRAQLNQTQRIVHQRVLIGDREHEYVPRTGWLGHLAAVVIAGIETTVTTRIFNISFTQLDVLAFIAWAGLTLGLAIFNVKVAEWLGGCIRDARELERSAETLNTLALTESYQGGRR